MSLPFRFRLSFPSPSIFPRTPRPPCLRNPHFNLLHRHSLPFHPLRLQTLRTSPNFRKGGRDVADHRRYWAILVQHSVYEADDDENDDDQTLELLLKFVHNLFKRISKKVRKTIRCLLPMAIPTELLTFSIDGVLMLAFLRLFKALIEVVCTHGSAVFVSILVIRVVWTGLAYFQEIRSARENSIGDDNSGWTGVKPAA